MSKRIHVRPGRGQSKIGFIGGLLFCAIGVFVVIPIFGPFGIVWTLFAGIITFVNFKNGFTDEQIDSHVIDIEENGEDVTVTSNRGYHSYSYKEERDFSTNDVESRLKKLQSLYEQGLISGTEYEEKKRDILGDL